MTQNHSLSLCSNKAISPGILTDPLKSKNQEILKEEKSILKKQYKLLVPDAPQDLFLL